MNEANSETIRQLWEQPALRYSNALDSIFHEQAIICEDDSDCRLFNATADHLAISDTTMRTDTAYIPTGGKHGAKKIAEVLRKVGVPLKAIFDMDFLSERDLVRDTVQAFGGNWSEIEADWNRVDAAVRKGIKRKSDPEIVEDLMLLLQKDGVNALNNRSILDTMNQGTPWKVVKRHGVSGIPNGDAQRDCSNLIEKLEKIGIYLVHVGVAENFCPDIGGRGPAFVTKLLSEVKVDDARLENLRAFVSHVQKGQHAPLG